MWGCEDRQTLQLVAKIWKWILEFVCKTRHHCDLLIFTEASVGIRRMIRVRRWRRAAWIYTFGARGVAG